MKENILINIENWQTPYQTIPFSKIKEECYADAFKFFIEKSNLEIEQIAENIEKPTFENTIEALAYSGRELERVASLFFNINSAETTENIQKIAQEVSPLLSEFSSKIFQNEKLFERIRIVKNEFSDSLLSKEQETLLEKTYTDFVRNGALLSEDKKKELEKINIEISLLNLQFGQNVLSATNQYVKHIESKEKLRGVPDRILEQYRQEALDRGLEGYVITLHYPNYIPAMTYISDRKLREELFVASGSRAFNDEFDNQEIIQKIIKLRFQKAQILGYKNYADYVLQERMVGSSSRVFGFLEELLEFSLPFALEEKKHLENLAKKDGIDQLQNYDHAYYAEKWRKEKLNLEEEELRPYFELSKVQGAVFDLAGRLFDLDFQPLDEVEKYHQEVQTYLVCDKKSGERKAILYVDYFPRKGKRAGAWMTSFSPQYQKNDKDFRPEISVVCNFSKPNQNTPSLLSFQEVTTLFHEFGHAIHGILASTKYPNLSGTSVKWDFVELPSQFLENYCYEPEFLNSFAKHYQTGEALSQEKIQKITELRTFMQGYQMLRQLGFGFLDMNYHIYQGGEVDLKAIEKSSLLKTSGVIYPLIDEVLQSCSFSHIFEGGYASGYYSYKWAEVLEADAFEYFKENGIFNQEIAQKYKILLSKGGAEDPRELYFQFRGSEPKVKNLLKRTFSV